MAWQIFKVSRKTFFNPGAWLGIDNLREYNHSLWTIIGDLFTPGSPVRAETFEEAKERYNLTEEDLKTIAANYFIYSILFLILGITLVAFSFYLLFVHSTGHGFILGLVASSLFFGQAFRFHFWYFQIKVRKLGCTFAEWRSGKVIDRTNT